MNIAELPKDIFNGILAFLSNDERSVGRLSSTCHVIYDRVLSNQELWKELVRRKWSTPIARRPEWNEPIRGSRIPSKQTQGNGDSDTRDQDSFLITPTVSPANPLCYRDIFLTRTKNDRLALDLLQGMAEDLREILGFNDNESTTMVDGASNLLGLRWDHSNYAILIPLGLDIYDTLKATASRIYRKFQSTEELDTSDVVVSVYEKILGFLAARTLQNVHFAYFLRKWNRLQDEEIQGQLNQQSVSAASREQNVDRDIVDEESRSHYNSTSLLDNARLLEEHAFAICEMQRIPLDIVQEERFQHSIQQAKDALDEIARACEERIESSLSGAEEYVPLSNTAKMELINDVIVKQYGFTGNSEDYYNYKNSLLDHVLQSKKGIPLTLSILYSCVCYRLGIPVQITGLPGHVVLGFDSDDGAFGHRVFMDVFHGGRMLSVADCRSIVSHYPVPWDDSYLEPLRNESVIQRVLNNLSHCHFQAMSNNTPFHSELFFQQRALVSIHRQPFGMARLLADRVADALPITLARDLLRTYRLMSER
ncbi:transglutaminase [Nitzschia inconspicua]|uniref:Transglutaminase n=1 Tax=Nitzschia inconspicua TaxID=303405 RepID=A0A9K3LYZ2_9STRA|nr:transglutaminase [Nitzschia inconspicua]